MRRMGEEGVSPIIGFVIATVVFSVSFYYVMESAIQQDPKPDQAKEYTATANALADIILSNGRNWYTPEACSGGVLQTASYSPEKVGELQGGVALGRLGLGDENCGMSSLDAGARNNLSFEKFRNLYQAKFFADPTNEKVDYIEARRSLGLAGQNVDFHIRTWPVLASVREILGTGVKDPLMRPLYIGDYGTSGGGFSAPTAVATEYSDHVLITIDIANSGTSTTMFTAVVTVKLKQGNIAFNLHSKAVAPAATAHLEFVLKKSSDWDWKGQKEINYQIWDRNSKLWPTGNGDAAISLSAIDMTKCGSPASTCALQRQVLAESDRMYFTTVSGSATVKVHHSAFDGKGNPVAISDWKLRLQDHNAVLVEEFPLPNSPVTTGFVTRSVTNPLSPAPTPYKAILMTDAGVEYNSVNVNVVDAAPDPFSSGGSYSYVAQASVVKEIAYIDLLIDKFDPYVIRSPYDTASVPYTCPSPLPAGCGDVFPDLRDVMNNDLRTALTDASGNPTTSKYTTLFVGSNVDHNAMTSQQAKGTIRDWVFAGGTLIVMGSDDQSVTWLQPIFHASLESASGGLYTPDQQHASLNVPNQLDYTTYLSGPTWSYNAGADASFTHVVQQGSNDILGIGNPGAFGLGKVILSSWRPYALTTNQADSCPEPPTSIPPDNSCQALFLIHNLVTLSYRELYLDYGPAVPVGEPTGAQLRIGSVWHPDLKQLIGVQIQVFVFPGGS